MGLASFKPGDDGPQGGNTIEDGVEIAKTLESTGAHMAVLSNGMNIESITSLFGNSLPKQARSEPPNRLIRWGMKFKKITEAEEIPFKELYLLDHAKKIRAAVKMPLCYIGGAQSLDNIDTVLNEGLDAVALGRALIFDPDFVNAMHDGTRLQNGCTACNQCVTMMYAPGGTACIDPGGHSGHAAKLNTIPASAE